MKKRTFPYAFQKAINLMRAKLCTSSLTMAVPLATLFISIASPRMEVMAGESSGIIGLGALPDGETWASPMATNADGSIVIGNAVGGLAAHGVRWTEESGL